VDQAWKCGIKGKMTGGGGGGTCVFAVTTESISEFQQICENNNWEIIVAELSSEGIRFD
jgi:mevalonate kinase